MFTAFAWWEVRDMYGGSSGCYGMIIYNTNIEGNNAVYGYYDEGRICLKTGPLDAMKKIKDVQDEDEYRASDTVKLLARMFLGYLAVVIAAFVVLPLKIAFALLLFCAGSYFPLLIIINARAGLYQDPEIRDQFRRYHGCEHATINALTNKKPAEMETFRNPQIYDSECGTAYSGYAILMTLELALLVVFWPGILKAAGILLLTIIILLVLILVPRINPFTIFQRPVVMAPTEKEFMLGIEIMKKLRELENGEILL